MAFLCSVSLSVFSPVGEDSMGLWRRPNPSLSKGLYWLKISKQETQIQAYYECCKQHVNRQLSRKFHEITCIWPALKSGQSSLNFCPYHTGTKSAYLFTHAIYLDWLYRKLHFSLVHVHGQCMQIRTNFLEGISLISGPHAMGHQVIRCWWVPGCGPIHRNTNIS